MALIRSHDTKPEIAMRAALRSVGFQFLVNDRSLPGSPDLVFPRRRVALFVHGCFWHAHRCQHEGRRPKVRRAYWLPKLEANKRRDANNRRRLAALGWHSLTVWECQLRKSREMVLARAVRFLRRKGRP